MPFNGSGTFTRYTPGTPYVSGTTIDQDVMNGELVDIDTGLSTVICKDGQTTTTASIPFAEGLSSAKLIDISGAQAGQIKFPATQNASSNANTLDDYEEGTFSIVVQGSSGAGVGTYSSQIGRYTKIGRIVHLTGYMNWSAHTGTGNLEIGALPFTVVNTTTPYTPLPVLTDAIALTAGNYCPGAYVIENSVYAVLVQTPTGGGAQTVVPIDTSGQLWVGGHYEANA